MQNTKKIGHKKTTVAPAASLWLTFSCASVTMAGGESQLTEDTATKSKVSQRISETRHSTQHWFNSERIEKRERKRVLVLLEEIFFIEGC